MTCGHLAKSGHCTRDYMAYCVLYGDVSVRRKMTVGCRYGIKSACMFVVRSLLVLF